jgi:hypothetical protein
MLEPFRPRWGGSESAAGGSVGPLFLQHSTLLTGVELDGTKAAPNYRSGALRSHARGGRMPV